MIKKEKDETFRSFIRKKDRNKGGIYKK